MHDAIVIGGGISGLTAAWKLKKDGRKVLVLEEGAVPGGNIRTVELDGFHAESGPHSFMGSSEFVWKLVDELNMLGEAEAADAVSANRYIFRDGRLHALPMSAGSFLTTRLLSFKGKMRLAMEPFVRRGGHPDETAWEFFVRRFGEEAAMYIMSPFISGVYAGDINALGARAAFGKFWYFEQESGSMIRGAMKYMKAKRKRLERAGVPTRRGLYSMKGGLGALTGRLARDLGEELVAGVAVDGLSRHESGVSVSAAGKEYTARAAVVAVPPVRAAALFNSAMPEVAGRLRAVPMVPVALAHWTSRNPVGQVPAGFGFLIPRVAGPRALGTLFPSQLFSGRAPDGQSLFASYYGGALDPEVLALDDEALFKLLLEEHTRILGFELVEPRLLKVIRNAHAIPQMVPEHLEAMEAVAARLESFPAVSLAGNYLTGVGVEAAVESGYRAASKCLAHLEG